MFELEKTPEVLRLIDITKSNSGISGPKLANAHIQLGRLLAKQLEIDPAETTVIAMLRGGIFFAQGIYFELGCQFDVFDPKYETYVRPATKNVILVDSVINTGKTISNYITPGTTVACCVINEKAVSLFKDKLITIRISKNSYIGSEVKIQQGQVGPDTTMRLFNQL